MHQRISTILVMLICATAHGQTIYRIVGPDGKMTFSDKPPLAAEQSKVTTASPGQRGSLAGNNLPFELRQTVGKYPVTLYTAPDCAPCSSGRALLERRGVPFVERTVTTPEDAAALQRITAESSLPVMTVGSQRIKGYSDVEWSQTLDAAGYPTVSILPSGFRNAAATPLVAVQATPSPRPAAESPVAPTPIEASTPTPMGPTPSNPAGITF